MIKPDRRIEKTQSAIFTAFFELMQKKRYSGITVQDIIDRANVGRTTFYAHFPTKDDLLFASVDHMLLSMSEFLSGDVFLPTKDIFTHVQENSSVLKGLMNSENSGLLFARFKSLWSGRVEEYLTSNSLDEKTLPVQIIAYHIVSTFFELVKWWVNTDMSYTDEQMETYYRALILPCLTGLPGSMKKLF
jgi:AcrR family transcriptional regulator